MNEGGSRKTILLFFFLFLHMEDTGEERRGEKEEVRHVRKSRGEDSRQTEDGRSESGGGAGETIV